MWCLHSTRNRSNLEWTWTLDDAAFQRRMNVGLAQMKSVAFRPVHHLAQRKEAVDVTGRFRIQVQVPVGGDVLEAKALATPARPCCKTPLQAPAPNLAWASFR